MLTWAEHNDIAYEEGSTSEAGALIVSLATFIAMLSSTIVNILYCIDKFIVSYNHFNCFYGENLSCVINI